MEPVTSLVRPAGLFPVALRIGCEELLLRDTVFSQLEGISAKEILEIAGRNFAMPKKDVGGGGKDDDMMGGGGKKKDKMEDFVGHIRVLVGDNDVTAQIRGVMVPRHDMWTYFGFDTAAEDIERLPGYAGGKDKKILNLVFDTPGGYVEGIPEAALALYNMREWGNVTAYVHNANSAGAWLASQADEIVIKPSGTVGSVGVRSMHVSYKKMMEESGIEITQFAIPEKKIELSPYSVLTESAIQHAQAQVELLYEEFVEAIARGREHDKMYVKENSGEGRVVSAVDALKDKMVDTIEPASEWDI